MNKLGEIFQVSLFGESHGSQIGVTISGIAPGILIDEDQIKADLSKRRPSLKSESPRQEQDDFTIISGVFNGYSTGAPLTVVISNQDVKSKNYERMKDVYRPSHADYSADVHYLGYQDYRGGGIFSGRLTAPLVIAGSIAMMILNNLGIDLETRIKRVGDLEDAKFSEQLEDDLLVIRNNKLNVISSDFEASLFNKIETIKAESDSLGAQLESIILNVEAGIGEPFFNKLDSKLAQYVMNIPAIKGVSFGSGFDYIHYQGSEVADEYYYDQGVKTYTNHNGGIIGGISTGMPILVNSVVKPTPTIFQELRTVNKMTHENTIIKAAGRHDSSIFTRIPIVVNSMLALALVDLYSIRYGYLIQRGKEK